MCTIYGSRRGEDGISCADREDMNLSGSHSPPSRIVFRGVYDSLRLKSSSSDLAAHISLTPQSGQCMMAPYASYSSRCEC